MITRYMLLSGAIEMEYEEDILYRLHYIPEEREIPSDMKASRSDFTEDVYRQLQEYTLGLRQTFNIKYRLIGSEFCQKVWEALLEIPYGETRSYKQIAQQIGKPTACQAVGQATNKNPIMIIVPCHRVIGSDGTLIGYVGGLELKETLLRIEHADL